MMRILLAIFMLYFIAGCGNEPKRTKQISKIDQTKLENSFDAQISEGETINPDPNNDIIITQKLESDRMPSLDSNNKNSEPVNDLVAVTVEPEVENMEDKAAEGLQEAESLELDRPEEKEIVDLQDASTPISDTEESLEANNGEDLSDGMNQDNIIEEIESTGDSPTVESIPEMITGASGTVSGSGETDSTDSADLSDGMNQDNIIEEIESTGDSPTIESIPEMITGASGTVSGSGGIDYCSEEIKCREENNPSRCSLSIGVDVIEREEDSSCLATNLIISYVCDNALEDTAVIDDIVCEPINVQEEPAPAK